jgi:ribosomal protein S18 acetylase RimI-like enzyme
MTVAVRRIEPRDQPRWRELWDAYTRFYEREPSDDQARYAWTRIMDPADRGAGTGKALIDWLVEEMATQGWSSLYWHTKENNYRARGLYDKYTPHSGFVRYIVKNPG